ncbi:hypothetical protein BgiBS90_018802, partial [Biomphalaria glabrata]
MPVLLKKIVRCFKNSFVAACNDRLPELVMYRPSVLPLETKQLTRLVLQEQSVDMESNLSTHNT